MDTAQEISLSDFIFPESDEITMSDSDLSLGEDLAEQLRLAEERACDFSYKDEPSNNNFSPNKDHSEDQPARDVDRSITLEFDTESEEDDVDDDKGPHQDERGDGKHPPKKPCGTSESKDGGLLLALQHTRQEPSSEEDDSDLSLGEDLAEQLRLAEERACDFSYQDDPSNNNIYHNKDPIEDQPAGDGDQSFTLELDTEIEEDDVDKDQIPHLEELEEEISFSDFVSPEIITIELDTESEEDEVDEEKGPHQDDLESDENTMPANVANVDRNISVGVVPVDEENPVLVDNDMPLLRSFSTGIGAVIFSKRINVFSFRTECL